MRAKVLVTEGPAADAVRSGEVEGDAYADGECWADPDSLRAWAERIAREQGVEGACACGHARDEHTATGGCAIGGCGCVQYEAWA